MDNSSLYQYEREALVEAGIKLWHAAEYIKDRHGCAIAFELIRERMFDIGDFVEGRKREEGIN